MNLLDFENIYQRTYDNTLKFIVIKCNNIDDINDIIQDTYIELYHKLQRKNIDAENEKNYIVGIAKNIIKRHYRKVKNENNEISINEYENMEVSDDINIEDNFITQENAKDVWNYIENKDIITTKVFYLYYILGYKIEEIAEEKLVEAYGKASTLKSTILKVAHHGSKTSTTEGFLELVSPQIALIGVGKNNLYGHPNSDVIGGLKEMRYKNL